MVRACALACDLRHDEWLVNLQRLLLLLLLVGLYLEKVGKFRMLPWGARRFRAVWLPTDCTNDRSLISNCRPMMQFLRSPPWLMLPNNLIHERVISSFLGHTHVQLRCHDQGRIKFVVDEIIHVPVSLLSLWLYWVNKTRPFVALKHHWVSHAWT